MTSPDPGGTDVTGVWDLTIRTPVGAQRAVLELHHMGDGLAGSVTGRLERIEVADVTLVGTTIRWRQTMTRPLRLHLEYVLVVDGDQMRGTSRAGRLLRSPVSAVRRR